MNKETTQPSSLNDLSDNKVYLPYTPPMLTVLEDSTIEGNVGSGADAGGYPGHNHS